MLPPNMKLQNKLKLNQRQFRIFKFAFFGTLCVCIAYIIAAIDPLERIVKDQLSIRDGSLLFGLFTKPPLEVFISVYVFNVTNVEAFVNKKDAKLKLEEVGPYVYQEFLDHSNYTFHANGTLSYFPRRSVVFVRERSVGDPESDIVTVPNIPLLGASAAAADMSIFAALALSTLTTTLNAQPMLNLTVHDYLWGYEDTLVKFAANIVPNIITFETFGILDRMFDEGENEVTIHLPNLVRNISKTKGLKENDMVDAEPEPVVSSDSWSSIFNIQAIHVKTDEQKIAKIANPIRDYSVETWNGNAGLQYWGYSETEPQKSKNSVCNTLRGAYDGTLFPQNISKGEEFRLYRKSFCRTLTIRFDHAGEMDGLEAYYFQLAENAFDSDMDDPNSSCFCSETKCLKKGLGNITPCYYNIPAAVSYPHFYRSDPSLLAGVEGLSPDPNKHGSEIVLQPRLGVPMRVHSRIQINLLLDTSKFNSRVKPFDNTVLPIVWMEVAVERLTPGLLVLLHMLFNVLPYVQAGFVCLLCIVGVAMFAGAALAYWFNASRVWWSPHDGASIEIHSNNDSAGASCCGSSPKRNIRHSAIYWFPYIRRETEKYSDDDPKYEHA